MLYNKSPLLKYGYTQVVSDEKCVIDTNELIARKLESYRQENKNAGSTGFRAGLNAPELEITMPPEYDEEGEQAYPVYDGPDPEELLAQAKEQIARMEEESRRRLETERMSIMAKAHEEGYKQGFEQGRKEGIAQSDARKREIEEEGYRLREEYEQIVEQLEPQFIDTLTGIYEHIFNVDLSAHREIIFNLVSNALNRIEGAKDYLVHVSKEDFPFVNMHKKEIAETCIMGNGNLEITEDMSLHRNECLIETESGIYDCGLGTQLSELSRKLKILSYEKE